MVITQRCHNVVKVTYLYNVGLQSCHIVMKIENMGMYPSHADNVKTDLTKIQPVGNVLVT